MKKRIFAAVCALCLFCLSCLLCGCSPETTAISGNFAMGSYVSVSAWGTGDMNRVSRQALKAIRELDTLISATSGDAEIARLNKNGEGTLHDLTLDILQKSLTVGMDSDYALNILLGRATSLWGFSADTPHLPERDALLAALETADPGNIEIEGNAVRLKNGASIDLGAVGKGAALDVAAKFLQERGAAAVVNFGGSVLFTGIRRENPVWSVGIRDPKGTPDSYFATLTFTPKAKTDVFCISTSGSYEKTFTEGERTYHHILDPKTGYPVENGLVSVTAVSTSGLFSDALSTALFVLGEGDTADRLINDYLLGAVFVYEDGRVSVSEGLRDLLNVLDPAYPIEQII